jgi:hypothetical protein
MCGVNVEVREEAAALCTVGVRNAGIYQKSAKASAENRTKLSSMFRRKKSPSFLANWRQVSAGARSSLRPLHLHGRAIGQHLGDSLHHFGGVVAHRDHGIRAMLGRVL